MRRIALAAVIAVTGSGNGWGAAAGTPYLEISEFAARHSLTVQQFADKAGMNVAGLQAYLVERERVGRNAGEILAPLLRGTLTRQRKVPSEVETVREESDEASSGSQATTLTASDIAAAVETYSKNEMRFVRDFKGRRFSSILPFENARQSLIEHGNFSVYMGEGGLVGKVECDTANPQDVRSIADWNKGDQINISGVVRDVTFGTLQLRQCSMKKFG